MNQQQPQNNHQLQIVPALQTRVDAITHLSHCTGNPYSQDLRELVIFIRQHMNNSNDWQVREMIVVLRMQHIYPLSIAVARWEHLLQEEGHLLPCRRAGNSQATRLTGPDLVYLALYRIAWPKCTIAEINAFLYRETWENRSLHFIQNNRFQSLRI